MMNLKPHISRQDVCCNEWPRGHHSSREQFCNVHHPNCSSYHEDNILIWEITTYDPIGSENRKTWFEHDRLNVLLLIEDNQFITVMEHIASRKEYIQYKKSQK